MVYSSKGMDKFAEKRNAEKGMLFGKPKAEVVKRPGAFKAKAEESGGSVEEKAKEVLKPGSKASARTKKQAVLAQTFAKMRKTK